MIHHLLLSLLFDLDVVMGPFPTRFKTTPRFPATPASLMEEIELLEAVRSGRAFCVAHGRGPRCLWYAAHPTVSALLGCIPIVAQSSKARTIC